MVAALVALGFGATFGAGAGDLLPMARN